MESIYFVLKLAGVVMVLLLVSYFVLNTVLSFIVRFSDQLRKASKNAAIAAGVAYIIGLFVFPGWTLEKSWPLVELIGTHFPGFLNV